MDTKLTKFGDIVDLIFKAMGLGMGVAALVLSIMGEATAETLFTLLAIGLVGLAISSLDNKA